MSNFLLRSPDCVLIHIPKTGGTSIRKGAWDKRVKGPRFGSIPEEWQGLFSFAFVRDPLDRFLSAYRMFTQGPAGDPDWSLPRDARSLTHAAFFDIVRDESIIHDERRSSFEEKIRHHAIPQTHPFNCLRQADFVGRFEDIDADFARIAKHVGLNSDLPRLHVTADAPVDPRSVLGAALADAVAGYYAEDYAFLDRELPGYRKLPQRGMRRVQTSPARGRIDRLRQNGTEDA